MPRSKLESLFVIPPNDSRTTFGADDKLPSLPLPDLHHTLERYLDSLKPFLTPAEYNTSAELVRKFEEGTGKSLHEKLKQKAEKERNWVEKWWEIYAYLNIRTPLLPYCSMNSVFPKAIDYYSYGTEEDQIKHASLYAYYLTQFWSLLRTETLLPNQTADKKTSFSMSQYRKLFNTVRVPGEKTDSSVSYFKTVSEGSCPSHVVVLCKGRVFSFNAVDDKQNEIINPLQWKAAFKKIMELCQESAEVIGVPILTCDTRENWSKNRRHLEELSEKNKQLIETIDKSLFVLVLDDDSPETDSDVTSSNQCGDYMNRWSDKSASIVFYKNGRSGAICDHTAFDGIVVLSCEHYILTAIEESRNEWDNKNVLSTCPEVEELIFELDKTLENEINRLKVETLANRKEILMTRNTFEDYGKIEIQRLKFHPDSYVQMCLQLAYFDIHRKPAACYETATTRKFYNGRTETLRSCTVQCLDWITSMLDPKYTNEERKALFETAIKRHDQLMSEAKENAGCDRHLLGIYCTALEEGVEIPELFSDPGYFKSGGGGNFVLSTSCTGYSSLGGGVAPMCVDGYGVFYNIMPNKICFTISVNTKSSETDAGKYFSSLKNSFRQTRQMLLWSDATKSKF